MGIRIETSWGIPHFTQSNYSQFSLIFFEGSLLILQYPNYSFPFLGQWEIRDAPFEGSSFTILKIRNFLLFWMLRLKLFPQYPFPIPSMGQAVSSTVFHSVDIHVFPTGRAPGWLGSAVKDRWVGTKRHEIRGWLGALEMVCRSVWMTWWPEKSWNDRWDWEKYDDSFMTISLCYDCLCYDYIIMLWLYYEIII